ncbi:MAG: tail fiber protein [Candidatus Magnetomorum sp.]|nr:tail fiber protein [Candidatus Magnetomorum sp.]
MAFAINASHAAKADEAAHATNADNATHASNADNANHATHASNADIASIADRATDASNIVPVGSIMPFAGRYNKIPVGWLLCDGLAIGRTQFNALFNVIGSFWGVGNNYSTFNLPDLRGYFLRGASLNTQRDPDATLRIRIHSGGNTGDIVGSYQDDSLKNHSHTYQHAGGPDPKRYDGGSRTAIDYFTYSTEPTSTVGGNETRPKNANVNYIIKY